MAGSCERTAAAERDESPSASGSARDAAADGPLRKVKVRRDPLADCMRCPICRKLFRDATTITECLHTFCRKCIYEKFTEEEADCCPSCNIHLGGSALEKLRPDHSIQDLMTKLFPFKRRKVDAPEVEPSFSLPTRRKERSLSSLVVNTPRIARRSGFTGRRSKAAVRKAASLRRRSPIIDESDGKEDAEAEDHARSSSSPETLAKMAQNRRQSSSNAEPSNHSHRQYMENDGKEFQDKAELWKPLNTLVEAANRTKPLKLGQQSHFTKAVASNGPDNEAHANKSKAREETNISKPHDEINGSDPMNQAILKARKMNGIKQKKKARGISAQALVDASGIKRERTTSPIWFSLIAALNKEGGARLPQISSCYLRIKDVNLPVSFIQKYLVQKLSLGSEAEVELTCKGQPVNPAIALHSLVDMWIQAGTSDRAPAYVGSSAKDFVMVLSYSRKASAS